MIRNMRRGAPAFLMIFVAVTLLGFSVGHAEQASGPIILTIGGDLWMWESAEAPMTQLTDWGLNEAPILSPDGSRIAYLSAASIFADWLSTVDGAGGFVPPQNIWVLDLPSRQTYRIAEQPLDAVWDGPNNPGKYILRSTPEWSPDGLHLAWVERNITLTTDEQVGNAALVLYDLVSQSAQYIDLFPVSRGFAGYFNIEWGKPGIAVKIGQGSYLTEWELRIYDTAGNLLTQQHFDEIFPSGMFSGIWVENAGQDYLFDKASFLWDWRTNQIETISGSPELYSLITPDGAHFFLSDEVWYLEFPDESPISLGDDVRPYSISRDGQSVVYGRNEIDPATGFFAHTLILHSPGQAVVIGRYPDIQLVWGPVGWRIRD